LGKSGVLRGRKGTTYHLDNGIRQKQLAAFGVDVVNQPIVIDGNVITSSSPATALDVAFKLLEMLTSPKSCQSVRHLMGFEFKEHEA
jgi:4-methyl-5(b-hydroxyethyl)-thiazole monophosphate biosynthesis